MMTPHHTWDVVVFGDEVESVLTAVSAAQMGVSVALVRRSSGRLGGLSVRGGLSYMDITPTFVNGLFQQFLAEAGVIRVALCPQKAANVLNLWLVQNNVTVFSGYDITPRFDQSAQHWQLSLSSVSEAEPLPLTAHHLIDASPDADLARGLGIPYTTGLGGLFKDANFIGVSPVFQLTGVPRSDLMAFEEKLRQDKTLQTHLAEALPHHPAALCEELITRPVFSPDDQDYIDILNPIIGIAFHHWQTGTYATYDTADVWIDGFNIARLPKDVLSCNGLVMRGQLFTLADLLALSQEKAPCPKPLVEAMIKFERFLQDVGGFSSVKVLPPESLYVRQTVNLHTKQIVSALSLLEGGVSPEAAVASFSYWIDLRGIEMRPYFNGESPPKPTFNIGLDCALPTLGIQDQLGFDQFAIVSRAGGYSPLGQGACRIVQHNCLLGEAIGIAAAIAVKNKTTIQTVIPAAVRMEWETRHGIAFTLGGDTHPQLADLCQNPLIYADHHHCLLPV